MRYMLLGVALVASATLASDVAGQSRASGAKNRPQAAIAIPIPGRPADAVSRPTGVSALTKAECLEIGGEVITGDQISFLCASNQYCRTFDDKGEARRMCLAAS